MYVCMCVYLLLTENKITSLNRLLAHTTNYNKQGVWLVGVANVNSLFPN